MDNNGYASAPVVQTKYGPIEGFIHTSTSSSGTQQAEIFLAVPYAEPPIGPLRMERPRSPKPWRVEKDDSTDRAKQCKAFGVGSVSLNPSAVELTGEDSLTVSVFRPRSKVYKRGGEENRAILVYIHGGGYCSGSSREYGYEQWVENFVLGEDLIFISVQYRLGPLGFLSAGGESTALPGNLG